jgi:hypothetical protein
VIVSAEIDTNGLVKALGVAAAYSSRTTVEVINGACRDIIFKASAQTKKADPKRIEADLTRSVYTITQSKTGRTLKKAKTGYQAALIVYKIVNKKRASRGLPGIAGQTMGQEATKFIKRRMNASGYIAYAGWNNALIAFGGRGFGTGKMKKRAAPADFGPAYSNADRGFGRPARIGDMIAEMANRATKAFEISGALVQRIVYEKQYDIVRHVNEKLAAKYRTL